MKREKKPMSVKEMKKTIKICNISSAIICAVVVLSTLGFGYAGKTGGIDATMMCCFLVVLCSNSETAKKLKKQLAEMESENVLA